MPPTTPQRQSGEVVADLQRTLDALHAALRETAHLRDEARRLYGPLLPRFLAKLLTRADDTALRAERLSRQAAQLAEQLVEPAES
jgi:phage baseplate assembly protein W